MTETTTPELRFEGLPPKLDDAISNYIDASYPERFVSFEAEAIGTATAQLLGASAIGIGLSDVAFTRWANHDHTSDELRQDANTRLSTVVQDIGSSLSHNPDQVEICRQTSEVGYACLENDVYNVQDQEGVLRFVNDEIATNGLDSQAAQQLRLTLPEANGARTEVFDSSIVEGLEKATDAYVAIIPDRPDEHTNAASGELIMTGGALILLAAGVSKWLATRYKKQWAALERAYDQAPSFRYPSYAKVFSPDLSYHDVKSVMDAADLPAERYSFGSYGRDIDNLVLKGGGKKARNERYVAVQEVVNRLPQPKSIAS